MLYKFSSTTLMLSKVIKDVIFVLLKKRKKGKKKSLFSFKWSNWQISLVIYLNLNLSSALPSDFQFTPVAQSENLIVQFAFTSPEIILNASPDTYEGSSS